MNAIELKNELIYFNKNKKLTGKYQLNEVTESMLENIGHEDPFLRDELICTYFSYMVRNNFYTEPELVDILKTLIDNKHLLYKLGEKYTLSVLTRAFSILVIEDLLFINIEKNYIPEGLFNETKKNIIKFYREEKDIRGYDEKYGWMHSTAHASDGLTTLIKNKLIKETDITEILEIMQNVFSNHEYAYINGEDERNVRVIQTIMEKNLLSEEKMIEWINSFNDRYEKISYPAKHYLDANLNNFLRSIYFRILKHNLSKNYLKPIEEVLAKNNRF